MLSSRANALRNWIVFGLILNVCTQLACQLASQQPASGLRAPRPRSMIALLRDPSGAKVQDAIGFLQTDPAWRLASLGTAHEDLSRLAMPEPTGSLRLPLQPSSPQLTAVSDRRGLLRFGIPENCLAAAGSGMVTTTAGLGALLPRLYAGRTPVITLRPMSLITTKSGGEPFVLIARATLPNGAQIVLPPLKGTSVRLPAGAYETWACSRKGLTWQYLDLEPGQRHDLKFAGPTQRLQLAEGAYVCPEEMPTLSLRQYSGPKYGGEANQVLLRGNAPKAPLISWLNGSITPARTTVAPANTNPQPWPPRKDRRKRELEYRLPDSAPTATTLLGLVRKDDGSFRMVAYAHNEGGTLRMPACPPRDAWLLLVAPGHAPTAQPWSRTQTGSMIRPEKGQSFSLNARDRGSLPIIDLMVSYTPRDNDAATVIARTDAAGAAQFGIVTAPGTLRVSDPRYANQEIELHEIPSNRLPISVQNGASITATVRFSDGEPGKAIVVTLRDPSSNMRPRERSVVTDVDTPFTFGGLPNDYSLLLIATAQRDGKTWSARKIIDPLDADRTITLHNEDPVLRATGR